ncbi:hypothetical protein ATCV1_z049R [Acanthocystis turfacea chlorella virus 1]|uniref:Uncharacterized protein z049R n=1 Tax=Chlorovirus heliozoae TaxID=322019 RepID=A7K809_9PHYC|nr:hypothetical protein ATCV1_z049R [Acanthocystis turfacea chlorella virus 1]ABT16183.1 hypothetical protein ATCV1_z049R [Acanthocystis turfacea chlorella virus 1]
MGSGGQGAQRPISSRKMSTRVSPARRRRLTYALASSWVANTPRTFRANLPLFWRQNSGPTKLTRA